MSGRLKSGKRPFTTHHEASRIKLRNVAAPSTGRRGPVSDGLTAKLKGWYIPAIITCLSVYLPNCIAAHGRTNSFEHQGPKNDLPYPTHVSRGPSRQHSPHLQVHW